MTRPLAMLLPAFLSSCGGQSQNEAVSACKDVVELGERYASTMNVIASQTKSEDLTLDQAADALLGNPALAKTTFNELAAIVASTTPTDLSSSTEYPQGNSGDQAKLLRAFVDRLKAAPHPGVLTTDLTYDVDNGNGVPERRKASCKFLMSNADSHEPLISYPTAVALETSRQKSFGPVDVPNKGYKCCVPQFALAKIDPRNGQPVTGGVIMEDEVESAVNAAMTAMPGGSR